MATFTQKEINALLNSLDHILNFKYKLILKLQKVRLILKVSIMVGIFLEKLRIFKTSLFILIILGVFANSALAEACFCGEACFHSFQDKTSTRSPFHHSCSGTHCDSCDLEKGQKLKAATPATQASYVKILDASFILSVLIDYPPTYPIFKGFDSFYVCETAPSSPIYLQNLSILC